MQTNPTGMGHRRSMLCKEDAERKKQHAALLDSGNALNTRLKSYGEDLERLEVFKYLGWLLSYDDNAWQAN